MSRISEKELVILGMLVDKPKYGYEIEKEIYETSMREWTDIAFSSIYYILNKLQSEGLITAKLETSEKNQTRKIYTITNEGLKFSKEMVQEIISNHEHTVWRIDLGLAYLNMLNKSEIINGLSQYETKVDELIQGYHNLHQYLTDNNCPINRLQLADRNIYLLKAEKEWVHEFQIQVKNKKE